MVNLSEELFATQWRAPRRNTSCPKAGLWKRTSEAWCFLKTFEDLRNPCHVMVVGPQADFVHQSLVAVVGFV